MAEAIDTAATPKAHLNPSSLQACVDATIGGRLAAEAFPAGATGSDDAHPAWAMAAAALRTVSSMAPDKSPDEATDPLFHASEVLDKAISSTRASSIAGVAEQVRLAVDCHDGGSCLGETEITGLRNALATLEKMAKEARA